MAIGYLATCVGFRRPKLFKSALALLGCLAVAVLAQVTALSAQDAKRWITYSSATGGLTFDYPPDVFTVLGGDPTEALRDRTEDRAGRIFSTADARAALQVARVPNLDGHSVTVLRNMALAASYKDAKLDYNRVAETWYVLSGTRGTETFYERVHFSCGGKRLDVWTVTYPTAEAKVFDALVDEMARRFRVTLQAVRCT